MYFDDKTNARIQDALQKLDKELKEGPVKYTSDQVTPAILMRAANYLESPRDKAAYAFLIYSAANNPEHKREVLEWAKELSEKNGKAVFSSLGKDASVIFAELATFVNQVSQEEIQSLANANPITFIEKIEELRRKGIGADILPTKKAIEEYIRALPDEKITLDMVYGTEDPDLQRRIVNLSSNDTKSIHLLFNDKILPIFLSLPDGKKRAEDLLLKAAGLDIHDDKPVKAGTIQLNSYLISVYKKALDIEQTAKERIALAAKKDPLVGIYQATLGYPSKKEATQYYLAALPRAHELLDNPEHAAHVVKMLNLLEPSQYAGQDHTLIPEKEIFRMLDRATSAQLYDLITLQKSSAGYLYTQGTYNEISKRFYEKLKAEGHTFSEIANSTPDRAKHIESFVETTSAYRRTDQFVKSTSIEEHQLIIDALFRKKEGIGANIASITSFIQALPKAHPLLPYIESTIINNALKGNEYDKADMGTIAHWYANQDKHPVSPENRKFFDGVKADNTFEIPPVKAVKSNQLLDAAGRNFQLHVFYNDEDGVSTFKSFSASLKADGWTYRKQDDFIIFSKERNGKRIEILASPPETDGSAVPKILDYVKEKNGVISVLSGRGHSHHMAEAIKVITPDTKIINMGGCWGHGYAWSIVEKSPEAHILSTTGVGRMSINNFNTRWLNEQILNGKDVDWKLLRAEWEKLKSDKTISNDVGSYISPDQNDQIHYIQLINKLYKRIFDQSKEAKPEQSSYLTNQFMHSLRPPAAQATDSQISMNNQAADRVIDRAMV